MSCDMQSKCKKHVFHKVGYSIKQFRCSLLVYHIVMILFYIATFPTLYVNSSW